MELLNNKVFLNLNFEQFLVRWIQISTQALEHCKRFSVMLEHWHESLRKGAEVFVILVGNDVIEEIFVVRSVGYRSLYLK